MDSFESSVLASSGITNPCKSLYDTDERSGIHELLTVYPRFALLMLAITASVETGFW
jgi:hypothetical protein